MCGFLQIEYYKKKYLRTVKTQEGLTDIVIILIKTIEVSQLDLKDNIKAFVKLQAKRKDL